MNRLPFAVLVAAGLCLAAEPLAYAAAAGRPNMIVLLADDLGWHDLGCTGSPNYRTPRIDRLAAEGMRFTEAHAAAPICSASRAALLTGQSPARLRYEFVPKFAAGRPLGPQPLQPPDFPTELPGGLPTVATQLRAAGYATAFFGKWHLNRHQGHYLGWRPRHGPESFGFDHCVDDFGAHPYGYGGQKQEPVRGEAFPEDSLTSKAVEFIRAPRERPFLLWMWFYQPETRFEQAKADISVEDFAIARSHPHAALRVGQRKLIHFFETGKAELYDLAADPSEQHDLAASRPEDAARMQGQLMTALESANARLPVPKSP